MRFFKNFLNIIILLSVCYKVNAEDYSKKPSEARHLLEITKHVFNINTKGIITVGASKGNWIEIYKKIGISKVLWVEANPKVAENLKKIKNNSIDVQVYSFAANDKDGSADFSLEGNGHIVDSNTNNNKNVIQIDSKRLDNFIPTVANISDYNAMYIDAEGAELKVLVGSDKILDSINYIICDVAYAKNAITNDSVDKIDTYLSSKGFVRTDTDSKNDNAGYALYINFKK